MGVANQLSGQIFRPRDTQILRNNDMRRRVILRLKNFRGDGDDVESGGD